MLFYSCLIRNKKFRIRIHNTALYLLTKLCMVPVPIVKKIENLLYRYLFEFI